MTRWLTAIDLREKVTGNGGWCDEEGEVVILNQHLHDHKVIWTSILDQPKSSALGVLNTEAEQHLLRFSFAVKDTQLTSKTSYFLAGTVSFSFSPTATRAFWNFCPQPFNEDAGLPFAPVSGQALQLTALWFDLAAAETRYLNEWQEGIVHSAGESSMELSLCRREAELPVHELSTTLSWFEEHTSKDLLAWPEYWPNAQHLVSRRLSIHLRTLDGDFNCWSRFEMGAADLLRWPACSSADYKVAQEVRRRL